MNQNKATSLKDFLLAYGNKKSDSEISQMLSISIDQKDAKEKFPLVCKRI